MMLMSNNEYEYCSSDFYDSGEDGKDTIQSLSPTAASVNSSTSLHHSPNSLNPGSAATAHDTAMTQTGMTPAATPDCGLPAGMEQQQSPSDSYGMNGHMSGRFALDSDYIDELASDLESRYWEQKPPENWTSEDVWHWIFSWAGDRFVDVEEVQPLAYSNMTGQQLCSMSRDDFVNLNPKYGGHIFQTLQQLSSQFREFRSAVAVNGYHVNHSNPTSPTHSPNGTNNLLTGGNGSAGPHNGSTSSSSTGAASAGNEFTFFPSLPSFDLLRSSCLDIDCQGSVPSSNASSASESDRDSTGSSLTAVMERSVVGLTNVVMHPNGSGLMSGGSGNHHNHHHHHHHQGQHLILHHSSMSSSPVGSLTLDVESNNNQLNSHSSLHLHPHSHHHHTSQMMGKQLHSSHPLLHPMHMTSGSSLASSSASSTTSTSPGLLSSSSSSILPIKKAGRRGRPPKKDAKSRNRQGKGNGKLWEFIRDLLLDPMTNPSFIRWERREDGIFKFVQSDKVAKLWGQRKQNPRMTYEKLSRAMRYYYKSQVLLPVFGRRLVYKFGPNATGWRPGTSAHSLHHHHTGSTAI